MQTDPSVGRTAAAAKGNAGRTDADRMSVARRDRARTDRARTDESRAAGAAHQSAMAVVGLWRRIGLPIGQLTTQLVITPACGLAGRVPGQSAGRPCAMSGGGTAGP